MPIDVVLEARRLTKRFGHVHALRGVDLTLHAGEIVGLVGDNGAGKSTLIKVLSGWHRADDGKVLVNGEPVRIHGTADARRYGVETLYQDLALAPDLDVVANLFLGREHLVPGLGARLGVLRGRAMRREAADILEGMSVRLPSLDVPVAQLSGGQRQIVAVARALAWAKRVVLLDEPTAALGVHQTEQVRLLVRATADRGIGVVLISHNLPELLDLVDRVVVMRLGRDVATFPAAQASTSLLVAAMAGLEAESGVGA